MLVLGQKFEDAAADRITQHIEGVHASLRSQASPE
jgi:hypothetical protein